MDIPWISIFGGVGGALVTFALARFVARRSEKRLSLSQNDQGFFLRSPFHEEGNPDNHLNVSWNGTGYTRLSRTAFRIINRGKATVSDFTLLAHFPASTEIIDVRQFSRPVEIRGVVVVTAKNKVQEFTVQLTNLEGGDDLVVAVLYNGDGPTYSALRGISDVKLVTPGAYVRKLELCSLAFALLLLIAGTVGVVMDSIRSESSKTQVVRDFEATHSVRVVNREKESFYTSLIFAANAAVFVPLASRYYRRFRKKREEEEGI